MAKKILLIDDSEIIRDAIVEEGVRRGYDVACATGFGDFQRVWGANKDARVILVDQQLEGFTGCKLVEIVKRYVDCMPPFFIYSANESAELTRTANVAGAKGCISKQTSYDSLFQTLAPYLM